MLVKPKWCTVVPVTNLDLDDEAIALGHGVSLTRTPEWVFADPWLRKLSRRAGRAVRSSRNALVVFSGAASLRSPDKRWNDSNDRKSTEDLHYELCLMANLALWLARPTPASLLHAFHASRLRGTWVIQASSRTPRLLCHRKDESQRLTRDDVVSAAELHGQVSTLHIRKRVWTPAFTALTALQMRSEPIRFLLLWSSLESIFGSQDPGGLYYRMAQRAGLFLGGDRTAAAQVSKVVEEICSMRADITYGRWKRNPRTRILMFKTEGLIRQSLVRILLDEHLRNTFAGNRRESYLDQLVFEDQ